MTRMNRQWVLARRPKGNVTLEDFEYREVPFAEPELKPGEILVKGLLYRVTPAMRTWMKETAQFVAPMTLNRPVTGSAAAEVIASNDPNFPVGTIIAVGVGWQDYAVLTPSKLMSPPRRKPSDMALIDFEGLYGGNSITAYFGLLRIGEPKSGETVLVSGAAGSTGAIAAQVAKIKGCRVIGLAGGRDKCDWLLKEAKLDAVIDYKSESVPERLKALAPGGINVFFDNVGGEILDAAIENMAPFGRVALCGQIASYNDGDSLAPGPRNMMRVVYWRLKLQGFLALDYLGEADTAIRDLRQWAGEGRIAHHEEIRKGFKALPETFLSLFRGSHLGTLLVESDESF